MGIVFRQSIKTSIVTAFGALLGLLIVYLSAHYIPKQELGYSRTLLYQAVIGSQLVLLGMHTTVYVFIHRYAVGDERRKILITLSLLMPLLVTLICSIFYFLFKSTIVTWYQPQDIAFVSQYFAWLPFYTLCWGMITLLEQYLNSQMKVAVSIFTREVVLRLCNIALIFLFGYGYIDFSRFIALSVFVHVIPVAIMLWIARSTEGFGLSFNTSAMSKDEYKAIGDFAIFHLFLNVSVSLLMYIDSVMLAALDKTGMEAGAVYFVAQSVISIYQIPYRSLAPASMPSINKAYERGDMDAVKNMFSRSAMNILIATVCFAAIIIANLDNAVAVVGDAYAAIPRVVLILMIGRSFDMMTGLNNELLSVSKYYRFNFYLSCILVLAVVILNYLFIPQWGIYGAAWSSTVALFLFNLAKLLFLWNKLRIQPFSKHTLTVLILGSVVTLIGLNIPYVMNAYMDTIFRTAVIIVAYVVLIIMFKPSEDLQNYLLSVKTNKRLF